jgi:hypothetical protein
LTLQRLVEIPDVASYTLIERNAMSNITEMNVMSNAVIYLNRREVMSNTVIHLNGKECHVKHRDAPQRKGMPCQTP